MGFCTKIACAGKNFKQQVPENYFLRFEQYAGALRSWTLKWVERTPEKRLWLYRGNSVVVSALAELRIRRDSSGGVSIGDLVTLMLDTAHCPNRPV
jgi:hypothetical protein